MHFRRPLIPCILAYAVGLWLIHDIHHTSPTLALGIAAIITLASVTTAALRRDTTPLLLLLILALGATVMGVRERQAHTAAHHIRQLDSPGVKIITGTIQATAELADTEKSRIVLKDVHITSGSQVIILPGRVQLTARTEHFTNSETPAVGERITFPGRIAPPAALQNFFGYNRLEALRHESIYATAIPMMVPGIIRTASTDTAGLWSRVDARLTRFRKSVGQHLQVTMWQREGRLMNAMLFNDLRSLNDDERQIFRDSGTFHLFAVSGMHVAILGFVLNLLFRALRFAPRASWIAVAIVLFIYLWIIGFVPSATRSYLMLFAFTAAYMLGREVDSLSALIFAIAVVIVADPAALWNAGFILSVVGVAAIVLFTPLLRMWFPWPDNTNRPDAFHTLADKTMEAAMATVAITLIMYPIQVYYFGFYNLLSPLANLLQAALSSAVLAAGVVAAAASLISESFGQIIGSSASLIMWIVFHISRWAASADYAIFHFHQLPVWLMLAVYAVLISGYYLVHRDTPEFPLKSRARFATHVFCGVGLFFVFNIWSNFHRDQLEIWAFDVGQGDATLIRFPDGKTMLIDAGISEPDMGKLVVIPQLRGLGIHMLDYIIATHDDTDHTGGLASVIRSTGAHNLLIPKGLKQDSISTREMLKAARQQNCIVQEISAGYKAKAGECHIEILNPPKNHPTSGVEILSSGVEILATIPTTPTLNSHHQPPFSVLPSPLSRAAGASDNDNSLVLRLTYRDFTALLMADAGKAVESRLINENNLKPVTLLKVGHHGSSSGTTQEFLRATSPKVAIISCGATNRFGHPNKDLLHRLTRTNTQVHRTDQNGAIKLTTNGHQIKVQAATEP